MCVNCLYLILLRKYRQLHNIIIYLLPSKHNRHKQTFSFNTHVRTLVQKLITGVLQLDIQLQNVRPMLVSGIRPLIGHVDAISDDRVQIGKLAIQILARLMKLDVQLG